MLLSMVACSQGPAESTPSQNGGETPKPNETPNGAPNDTPGETPHETPGDDTDVNDPESLNIKIDEIDYENKAFTVYHYTTPNYEFDVMENASEGDAVNDALYKRILYTEQDLGIDVIYHGETGHNGHEQAFVDKLNNMISDPNTPVDLIASYSRTAPHVIIEGLYLDLQVYSDALDFSKAWWPENVCDVHAIKGRSFVVSGDISPGTINMLEVIFLNKTRLESFGYVDFMEKIKVGKWYMDDLIEMSSGKYEDLDKEPGESMGDFYGMTDGGGHIDYYTGMGFKYFDFSKEEDQVYVISEDYTSETMSNVVSKLQDWAAQPGVWLGCTDYLENRTLFYAGLSLFAQFRTAYFNPADTEVDFIAIPLPKLDEKQEKYITTIGDPYALYGICTKTHDAQRAAEAMQVMGYYGYKYITPALFDVTLKGKLSKDDYAIIMFELLRKGITFDAGKTYELYSATELPQLFAINIESGKPWTSVLSTTKKKLLGTKIKNLNKKLIAVIQESE